MNPNVNWSQLGDWYNTLCHGLIYLREHDYGHAEMAFDDVIDALEKIRNTQGGVMSSFRELAEAEGPEFHDGHDHEGFKGGCERHGHSADQCPVNTREALRVKDIRRLLEYRDRLKEGNPVFADKLFFEVLKVILQD